MIKILVVDDEQLNLDLMEAMLVPAGYSVICARDGMEAVNKALLSIPDVILLDVMMPIMDGFEVAARIREHDNLKNIPIVMVTALGEVKHRVQALESGADDYLTKPVDETELLTRVRTLVEKSDRINKLIVPKKKSVVPAVILSIAVLAAAGALAYAISNQPDPQLVVVEKDVIRILPGENITEIEYRDIIQYVEKPVSFKHFSSLDELTGWLETVRQSTTTVFFSAEGKDLNYDCDDYALDLQERAMEDGYWLDTQIEAGNPPHMMNMAIIGNEIYYVEPQTGEVRLVYLIDTP